MAKKQTFLHGAAILAAGVAIVKLIGALFKIPLGNLLDGVGYGHFNIAYSVYNVLLVLSTAGLPVAVSKMVAESMARGRAREVSNTVKAALKLFLAVGAVGTVVMFGFAEQIAALMSSPGSALTIRAISPAVFFVAAMSVFRGYYQGLSNMYPTAISQVIEAFSKLVIGFGFAWYLIATGEPQEVAAAGAILGVTIGTALGALFMVLRRAFDRNPPRGDSLESRAQGELMKSLLSIAIPITIGSGVLALTNFIDTTLVMGRLQSAAGYTEEGSVWLYGAYGLAQTMFNFPSAFIVPFAVSIVPAVTSAVTRGDRLGATRTIETSLRLTSLLSLPAAAGLSVLAGPILGLIFMVRPDEAAAATVPLNILGVAVFFNCTVLLTNAVLQSLGRVRLPVYTMLCGSVAKIAANWVLVGIPAININGAPIGTCLCYALIMILNLIAIRRHVDPAPRLLRVFAKPLAATAVMAVAAWAVNGLLSRFTSASIAVLAAIAVAVMVYLVLVLALRAITREDLKLLPKGEKIANLLRLK